MMARIYLLESGFYASEAAYHRIMEASNLPPEEWHERNKRGDTSIKTLFYDVIACDADDNNLYYETFRVIDRYDLEDAMIELARQKGLTGEVRVFYCEATMGSGLDKFTYRYR